MNRRSFIKTGLLWLATPPAIIAATPQQVILLGKPPAAPAAGVVDTFVGVTRYVNTGSTAGGDGTTNATEGANRAYPSLSAALLAEAPAPNPLTHALRIYCSGMTADTTHTDHTPWEFYTTSDYYVWVIGDNTTGKWNTSAFRMEITDASAIYNQYAAHVRLTNLQIMVKVTTTTARNCLRLATANNDISGGVVDHRVNGCIVRKDPTSTGSGNVYGFINSDPLSAGGSMRVWNSIAYGCWIGFDGDTSAWIQSNLRYYNCTGYGSLINFSDGGICVNCLGSDQQGAFDFFGMSASSDHCASSDATAPGTNKRINQTFTFVDAVNGDFHLQASDAGAVGYGLSDPASGLFADDIDGQVRTGAWDIGADQH